MDSVRKSPLDSFEVVLERWRSEWNVPNVIEVGRYYSDNQLLIDLTNESDREELHQLILRKHFDEVAREFISCSDWHESSDGHYITEFVTSLVRSDLLVESEAKEERRKEPVALVSREEFLCPPGSDWLYLKLHCSKSVQERLIVDASKLMGQLREKGSIEQWFFVRYRDPFDHLRIRAKVRIEDLHSTVIPAVCKWASDWVATKICSTFSLETYDREVERYGGESAMTLVESLFNIDSEVAAKLFASPQFDKLNPIVVTAMSIATTLECFGLNRGASLAWLQRGIGVGAKRLVSSEYRQLKKQMCDLIGGELVLPESQQYARVRGTLVESINAITATADGIKHLPLRGKKTISVVLDSIVHMQCNRLLFGLNPNSELRARTLLANTLETLTKRGLKRSKQTCDL